MSLPPYDAHVIIRYTSGEPVAAAELAAVSDRFRPLAEHLAGLPLGSRQTALGGFLSGQPDRTAIEAVLVAVDPMKPAPPIDPPRRFATCSDVARLQSSIAWVWKGWLPSARVVGVAAAEGVGKTRFAMDLARRAWHGEPFPDGQAMTLPPKSPTIWVAADGQHDELAQALSSMSMPPEAIVFPTAPDDPYGNTSLDDAETFDALNEAVKIHKPVFVIVDSLTNATRSDIGEQRTIATLKDPLVTLAQTFQVIVMLLLHVSLSGQALGRRIRGITRTLMHLECPDPARPERLRLWMEKSYAAKPPALGVTIGDSGNTYDFNPPVKVDPSKGGRPPEKLDKAIAFLEGKLSAGDRKGCELIHEWRSLGEAKTTIFDAKNSMEAAGRLVVDASVKPQIWHLVPPKP
ncbi:MAG: AAA family ATPase [Isosphaeraceae bacterium]